MSNTSDQLYDIPQAASELDLTEGYIRKMIRDGVIETTKVPIKEGSSVTKHMIPKSELYAFASREGAKSPRRKDGRGKHCFYSTDEEARIIKEILYKTHDPGLMIVAETIQTKETQNGYYVSPSKRGRSIVEQPQLEDRSGESQVFVQRPD